ncbi:unnamed protein product, partial [Adineta steineri]
PRFMHLDEDRAALYVADSYNNRIQKFIIGGNGTGITVAGGNGAGTNLNQLSRPSGVWVTRNGQTLYIADSNNNRVMRWNLGDTQGSVVAGSATGAGGNTNTLLSYPADVALDPTETYLYVSDYYNNRLCPSRQYKLYKQILDQYGYITPESSIRNITSVAKTADLHTGLYDLTDMIMYISNARGTNETGPFEAYQRQFVKINHNIEFARPYPSFK